MAKRIYSAHKHSHSHTYVYTYVGTYTYEHAHEHAHISAKPERHVAVYEAFTDHHRHSDDPYRPFQFCPDRPA